MIRDDPFYGNDCPWLLANWLHRGIDTKNGHLRPRLRSVNSKKIPLQGG